MSFQSDQLILRARQLFTCWDFLNIITQNDYNLNEKTKSAIVALYLSLLVKRELS